MVNPSECQQLQSEHCNAIRQDTSNQQLHHKFNNPWLKYSRNQRVIVTASSVPGENEFNVKTALQTLMEISTNGILHVQYSSRWVYNSTDPEKEVEPIITTVRGHFTYIETL